jgi:hypothetical protein
MKDCIKNTQKMHNIEGQKINNLWSTPQNYPVFQLKPSFKIK